MGGRENQGGEIGLFHNKEPFVKRIENASQIILHRDKDFSIFCYLVFQNPFNFKCIYSKLFNNFIEKKYT